MEVSPDNASDVEAYNAVDDEALAAWDPDGDAGRKYLLNPAIFRMLGPLAGRRVLDAGCGQGYLCRLMARRGADVTGVEPASRLVEYARRSEEREPLGIRYYQRDLSRLGSLDERPFDAVVANMVLLDIADWESAMASCIAAVRDGGTFVFSTLHPCWPADAMSTWSAHRRVHITEYLAPYEIPTPYGTNYHRPLSAYLNHAITLGASIDEIAEPAPADGLPPDALSEICDHIPNYVVVRLTKR